MQMTSGGCTGAGEEFVTGQGKTGFRKKGGDCQFLLLFSKHDGILLSR